ncbi:MAG: hypothetical protein Q7S45_01670 [Candidatus Curtissbacteria bacterium]|nr:hypothetical protein [Candidatus Curtissbacteria bacterium]
MAALRPLSTLAEGVTNQEYQFPWSRDEILFGPNAGFIEAKKGIPLGVYAASGIRPDLVNLSMAPWNNLANSMGRTDLFYFEENPSRAKIIIGQSTKDYSYTVANPDFKSPYLRCDIYLVNQWIGVITHELGHTLGFVDFIYKDTDPRDYFNPKRCDLPDKPIHSIMAQNFIVTPTVLIGPDDGIMLRLAGYV